MEIYGNRECCPQSYLFKDECKFSPDSASQFIQDVNSLMPSVCVFTEVNC